MKIYAPVKDANGVWASVRFVNGVGETDNPRLIQWFKTHGYTVEAVEVEEEPIFDIEPQVEEEPVELMGYSDKPREFEDMTPNELREFAKANGYGSKIKNIRNKEKLIEILRG